MFENFRTKHLDGVLAAVRASPHVKFEHFAPVYAAIEHYIIDHRLLVSDEKQDVIRAFKIYGPSIFFHANALANMLAGLMPWIQLNTDVHELEFTIVVDSVPLVHMYNVNAEFAKIIEPCIEAITSARKIAYVPGEIELVDVYHRLYSPSSAKTWDTLRSFEERQWAAFRATRNNIVTCAGVSGGGSGAAEYTELVLAWAAANPAAIIVGNHALTCMSAHSCTTSGAIQLVVADTKNAIAALRRHITNATGIETNLKKYELNLPSDLRLRKYVLSAKVGKSTYYIANVFNSPTYELVPWVQIGSNRIGTLCVLLRFLFIDLWFIRILRHFELLADPDFKRITSVLFDNIDTVHSQWAYESITEPPSYIGIHVDEAISKKVDQAAFPYWPAKYKAEHGSYRKIGRA
jgi:hypothetical protein